MRSDTITMEKEIAELELEVESYKAGLEAIGGTDLTVVHEWQELTILHVVIARLTLEGRFKR